MKIVFKSLTVILFLLALCFSENADLKAYDGHGPLCQHTYKSMCKYEYPDGDLFLIWGTFKIDRYDKEMEV